MATGMACHKSELVAAVYQHDMVERLYSSY